MEGGETHQGIMLKKHALTGLHLGRGVKGGGKSMGENFMGGAYVARFVRGRGHVPPAWRLRQS